MIDWLTRWASGLRFPTLLAVIGSLFLVDLAVPDLIPFVDELLLGLLTVLFASIRKRRGARDGEKVIDVEGDRDSGESPPANR